MKVYLIEISNMSRGWYHDVAYLDRTVAAGNCKQFEGEFQSAKPVEAEGEEIQGDRVLVDRTVYKLDLTNGRDFLRARGMAKLTPEERAALGL